MLSMEEIGLEGKRVLIREDFNVPMKNGNITHTARIDCALPTIKNALLKGAKVILMSHLGRPVEGKFDATLSLQPIADYLEKALQMPVPVFTLDQKVPDLKAGQIALLENVRFLNGEEQNSPTLSKQLAALCDVFVMDAFAVAHRAQASTCGVAEFAPIACAGPLLQKELMAVNKVLVEGQSPIIAIVGGSKVSTKLNLLTHLLDKVDVLVVGGGIANTFLSALGFPIGESLYEKELVSLSRVLIEKAQHLGKKLWLPTDVIVANSLTDTQGVAKLCEDVEDNEKIFDIGPDSQENLTQLLLQAKTILWNGPVGVFEYPAFAAGTKALAKAIANSAAYSVAGGGDTLAAIETFQVAENISYLSTGGGAFLEALEGISLPAVAALENRAK